MRSYIEGLYRHVEQANQARERATQQEAASLHGPARSRVQPLEQQITEFMRSLPPAQADSPWTMDELVIRLRGRYHDHPHPQHVATALRKLGWQRRRVYGAQGGGRRYWRPS